MFNKSLNQIKDSEIERIEALALIKKRDKTISNINELYEIFSEYHYFKVTEKKYGVEAVRNFLRAMKLQKFEPYSTVVTAGEIFNKCYFILKGKVELLANKNVDKDKATNILLEGAVFGEKSLIEKRKR